MIQLIFRLLVALGTVRVSSWLFSAGRNDKGGNGDDPGDDDGNGDGGGNGSGGGSDGGSGGDGGEGEVDIPSGGLKEEIMEAIRGFLGMSAEGAAETVVDSYETLTAETLMMDLPGGAGTLTYARPSSPAWQTIYDAASPTGMGLTFVVGVLLLIACLHGRKVIQLFNLGTAASGRQTKQKFWTGLLAIMFWYWGAITLLHFEQAITMVLLPDMDQLTLLVERNLNPNTLVEQGATVDLTNIAAFMFIGAMGFIGLFLLFFLREMLVWTIIYVGPIGLALSFSGIPHVEEYARKAMVRFVPLVLLPIPAAVIFRGLNFYFDIAEGTAGTQLDLGIELMLGIAPLLSLYVCWKSFAAVNPMLGSAIETTVKTTGSIGLNIASLGGRIPGAAGAEKMFGNGAGAATLVGGTKGLVRHQARRAAYSGRRQDPDPSSSSGGGSSSNNGSSSDDEWQELRRNDQGGGWGTVTSSSGDTRSATSATSGGSSADSTGPGVGGPVGGSTMSQPQIPPGGSGVASSSTDGEADYVASEAPVDDLSVDDPTASGPGGRSVVQSGSGSPRGSDRGGSSDGPGRQPQTTYYDPERGVRRGPVSRARRRATPSEGAIGSTAESHFSSTEGQSPASSQQVQQAQLAMLRAIRAQINNDPESDGQSTGPIDVRSRGEDDGTGRRTDDNGE